MSADCVNPELPKVDEFFNVATHNGCITMFNPETGQHRTFRIRTQPKDSTFNPGSRIVALLTGPDNTHDYQQFGFVNPNGSIVLWRRFRDSAVFQAYVNMLRFPKTYMERHGIQYRYEGRCRVCNAKLTNPDSIISGIGPICGGRQAGDVGEGDGGDED